MKTLHKTLVAVVALFVLALIWTVAIRTGPLLALGGPQKSLGLTYRVSHF